MAISNAHMLMFDWWTFSAFKKYYTERSNMIVHYNKHYNVRIPPLYLFDCPVFKCNNKVVESSLIRSLCG